MRPTLDEYALRVAASAATRSEDPHRQVGAVVMNRHGIVLAVGYNGPPSAVDLSPAEWADRDIARLLTVHAEANALRFVRPGEATMLATTYGPCAGCILLARSQGIRRVVMAQEPGPRWAADASQVAWRVGVELKLLRPTIPYVEKDGSIVG